MPHKFYIALYCIIFYCNIPAFQKTSKASFFFLKASMGERHQNLCWQFLVKTPTVCNCHLCSQWHIAFCHFQWKKLRWKRYKGRYSCKNKGDLFRMYLFCLWLHISCFPSACFTLPLSFSMLSGSLAASGKTDKATVYREGQRQMLGVAPHPPNSKSLPLGVSKSTLGVNKSTLGQPPSLGTLPHNPSW